MLTNGKTTKDRIVEFIKQNPGYEAREIDDALDLAEKTTSAYVKTAIDAKLIRREKNERDVFIYFSLGTKKVKKAHTPPLLTKKTVPVPSKNTVEVTDYDKMMMTVNTCPGLTSGEVSQIAGTLVNNVSSCFTKKRRTGQLTRTYNSKAQSIWFPVPFSGRRIPADRKKVEELLANGIDYDKEQIRGEPIVAKPKEKKEKVVKKEDPKEKVEKDVSNGMEALLAENKRMGTEMEGLEADVSIAQTMLEDLNKQVQVLAQLAERRKKMDKLKEKKASLSSAIEETSKRLFKLKDSILQ